jgi:site-specific DNA-methyltransferase (adenine-specific)
MNIELKLGDCLEVLKTIPDNSIDSVVTDPPYHLTSIVKRFGKEDSAPAQFGTDGAYARASKGFMGKEWDGGDIAFRTEVWSECYRILKPGGHLLAFSHSRTYHRMAVAVEDAGFEIRDQIMWVYGSGFPKSHNIGKAIDKIEGNEREVVGERPQRGSLKEDIPFQKNTSKHAVETITKGNSEWEGWGTALKPAHEPIVMARKPLSEKSIAENVLKHGTGGINIDGSRIGTDEITTNGYGDKGFVAQEGYEPSTHQGRFPANIIFDEEAGQLLDEQSGVSKSKSGGKSTGRNFGGQTTKDRDRTGHDDKGGASRFFYCPKAAKKDRNEGLDNFEDKKSRKWRDDKGMKYTGSGNLRNEVSKNHHPTVKPTDLMRYLINLITPPNGTILDPFMGSGSTGKAAVRCGLNFIGIEKEQEYMDIAKARIEHERNKPIQQKLL